jgi:DNA-binding MarR family transcriptional regulator
VVNVKSVNDHVQVANRLRPLLLKLARELRREAHPLGVTGGQVSLLIQIFRNYGIGVRDLAALEGISPAAISGHVRRLEKAGLVSRALDADDRRRQGLVVTPKGVDLLRSVKRRRTAWLAKRLKTLSPEELEVVDNAVDVLVQLLEEEA